MINPCWLSVGKEEPLQWHWLQTKKPRSSCGKVVTSSELNVNLWCALTAKFLHYMNRITFHRLKDTAVNHLCDICQTVFWECIKFCPPVQQTREKGGQASGRPPRSWGLKHWPHGKGLVKVGWIRLEKGWLQCTRFSTNRGSWRRWMWSYHSVPEQKGERQWG